METKDQLIHSIKEWIKIDNEMSQLKKQVKELNQKKKTITGDLVNVMKSNQIDCFDINGGSLVYKKKITKKTINPKTLISGLRQFFKDDFKTAETLNQFILDLREEKIEETIKRKVDKP